MNELLHLFNTLIASDYNIRVLHWKVIGLDFGTKHEMMDDYHSKLNEMIDEVGEVILMMNGSIPSLKEVVDNNDFVILPGDENYDVQRLLGIIGVIFGRLISLYENVINSGNVPSDVVSKLEEDLYWLRKEKQYKLNKYLTPAAVTESFISFCDNMTIND